MTETAITRNLVVQRWGTPQMTIGSVNEPRELEENGVSFNEKWAYRGAQVEAHQPRERFIYWHRYNFVASFVVGKDGRLVREDVTALLAGLSDRAYRPAAAHAHDG